MYRLDSSGNSRPSEPTPNNLSHVKVGLRQTPENIGYCEKGQCSSSRTMSYKDPASRPANTTFRKARRRGLIPIPLWTRFGVTRSKEDSHQNHTGGPAGVARRSQVGKISSVFVQLVHGSRVKRLTSVWRRLCVRRKARQPGCAMDASIIICTVNRATELRATLSSVATVQLPGRTELLVMDNGSTDDTRRVVEDAATWFPFPVRYFF